MNCKKDIDELLAKYFVRETLTGEEQKEVDEWISSHREEFEKMKMLVDAPLQDTSSIEFDVKGAWQKIDSELKEGGWTKFSRRRVNMLVSLAASVLVVLGIGLYYWQYFTSEDEVTRYANNGTKMQEIMLPDSSEIILYPSTKLTYQQAPRGRQVTLEGKAFFRVKKIHGLPFGVKTEKLQVEVLGTSFLVDEGKENGGSVFVKTGKVKVSSADKEVIIEKNEKAELHNGQLETGIIENPSSFFKAFHSVMNFENTPMEKVVKEIEKNTGILIELEEGIENNLVTTRIEGENGQDIVTELAFLCGCKYETLEDGKHYRLYSAK